MEKIAAHGPNIIDHDKGRARAMWLALLSQRADPDPRPETSFVLSRRDSARLPPSPLSLSLSLSFRFSSSFDCKSIHRFEALASNPKGPNSQTHCQAPRYVPAITVKPSTICPIHASSRLLLSLSLLFFGFYYRWPDSGDFSVAFFHSSS